MFSLRDSYRRILATITPYDESSLTVPGEKAPFSFEVLCFFVAKDLSVPQSARDERYVCFKTFGVVVDRALLLGAHVGSHQ